MAIVSSSTSSNPYSYLGLSGSSSSSSSSSSNSTQQMADQFMTLLVTQLQNQDPLNPMDNAQMTSQLAQISTVQSLEKLNTAFASLESAYQSTQTMAAANLIGKSVLVPGKTLTLASGQAIGGVDLASDADKVTITVKDSSGKVVHSQTLEDKDAGSFAFAWDGKDSDGNQLKDGDYTFSVTATQGSNKVTATALTLGTVSALINTGSGFKLDLGSVGQVDFASVKQVY